jgi:hypothetical protein
MFEPINRKAPEDRRSVPLDPASMPTIVAGQVLETNGSGYAVLADAGAHVVTDPMWAFTATARLDTTIAKSVSIIEAPFSARLGTEGYDGSPVKGSALAVGTAGTAGKLVIVASVDTVAKLQSLVAYCTKAPDSAGTIVIKAIR